MLRNLLRPTAIIVTVAAFSGCTQPGRLPSAPTLSIGPPAAIPGAAANATPMALGQTVVRILTDADPPCGIQNLPSPPEPCQRFAVFVDRQARLKVRLTSHDPGELTLRVGTTMYWGRALDVSASVESGATYEISVALHGGTGSQSFELIAILEPR